jgi:hypothetical protein
MHFHGFGVGLVDFAFFWLCAYFADANYQPATRYRWVFFVGFVLLAVAFLLAFANDVGAHIFT